MRKNSLGVIYVKTHRDSEEEEKRVLEELNTQLNTDWFMVSVNGDEIPDLSQCLNIGIDFCIKQGAEYIHWMHNDFHYDDPEWFPCLKQILDCYPQVIKACASNSRDPIGKWRIGQEQSWLMRADYFSYLPFLYFDERFVRCGGCEDYLQHLNILSRGGLVIITPDCTVHHKGAQTRSQYNTTEHQLFNQGVFSQISGFGQLIEVHDPKYFGMLWSDDELKSIVEGVPTKLREALNLESIPCDPGRFRLPFNVSRQAYESQIFPFRKKVS